MISGGVWFRHALAEMEKFRNVAGIQAPTDRLSCSIPQGKPQALFPIRPPGLTWCIPYGYNSHRSRLGRDYRPKLFRKTNISNNVDGALHPIVGRSGPDTVGLFTFLTLSDFRVSLGSAKSIQGATPISLSSRVIIFNGYWSSPAPDIWHTQKSAATLQERYWRSLSMWPRTVEPKKPKPCFVQ
jgi:hypothetical protein